MLTKAERMIGRALSTGKTCVVPTERAYEGNVVPRDGRTGVLLGIKGPYLRVRWNGQALIHTYHEDLVALLEEQ